MMRMPQLGRAVYVILGLAILVLVVTYGSMDLWPRVEAYRRMRALDRRWHDPEPAAGRARQAAQMLAEFGPDAAPYLLAAARDADVRVRGRAYLYLSGLDPVPEEAVVICLAAPEGRPRAPGPGLGGRVAGDGGLHVPGEPGRSAAIHHRIAGGGRARPVAGRPLCGGAGHDRRQCGER